MMKVASLRARLTLEQPGGVSDNSGGVTLTWTIVASLWGNIRPTGGNEQLRFDREHANVDHLIRIRFRYDIKSNMRFRADTRTFEIRRVADPDGRRQWLDCLCEERPQ
jgi:SPP1 family predicted phage head-tail adaptor